MKLLRDDSVVSGIFGKLTSDDMKLGLFTLEHAFPVTTQNPVIYVPVIPPGVYTCKRGLHRLHGMAEDFETFEITGVAGHQGLLFHWGDYNRDSEGCVIVGQTRQGIVGVFNHSRHAGFLEFMDYLTGIDEFPLTVE